MDNATYEMVDGLLSHVQEKDGRETALNLLEVGVQTGKLKEHAGVVAMRYGMTPETVIDWFAETLNRRVQEAAKLLEALTKERIKDE